ncbi:hypothetical protein [Corynebacterium sp. A21]|uniref:hypothetical protein n=1 Tax=Corynebacterium sp. A21 TaxID=3457318 RepID=UPI003FCF2412
MKVASTEPERAGYLLVGGLAAGTRFLGHEKLASSFRWALPPLLAGTVLRSNLAVAEKSILLAGLGAGLVGEIEKTRNAAYPSATGIAGVTGQHLAYSVLLVHRGAQPSWISSQLRGLAWISGVGMAFSGGTALVIASLIAGAGVISTSTLSQSRDLQDGPLSRQGLDHAGNLILASEGLALLGALNTKKFHTLGKLLDSAMTGTGVVGHLLLVDGLVRT